MGTSSIRRLVIIACVASTVCMVAHQISAQSAPASIGVFQGQDDVGTLLHPGAAEFDATTKTYVLSGSGQDIWLAKDDFHFVWTKVSAKDVSLTADISLLGEGGDNHRKGVLMIRQSLDPDSAYADVARHGDGLTSLQFRDEKGATTHEIESNVSGPERLRVEKRGDRFYMWLGSAAGDMQFAGGSTRVLLKTPFYVGIGVCAHNKDAVQKAVFSNVNLETNSRAFKGPRTAYSTLETITVASTDARVSYVSRENLGAPSWDEDGASLIFQAPGKTERVSYNGGMPSPSGLRTDEKREIAKDSQPRLSPDGKQTALLTSSKEGKDLVVVSQADKSQRVIASFEGGRGSLSAHPWSPDSRRLTFISYQSVSSQPEK